jgi:putative phosphoesterase
MGKSQADHIESGGAVTIGVISDTHGLLRPQALELLRGSEYIIHAGDVGQPEILEQLREIAPVTAVRGNVDKGPWAKKLPTTEVLEVGKVCIYVLHVLDELDLDPKAAGFAAVIYGHSHCPEQLVKDGVLYFNPGSAGPRRFKLPISLGKLTLKDGKVAARLVGLVE